MAAMLGITHRSPLMWFMSQWEESQFTELRTIPY